MKKFALMILLISCLLCFRNRTGELHGTLIVKETEMSLIVQASGDDATYRYQDHSPDEKILGIPASAINFKNSTFNIVIANLDFRLVLEEIAGWVQKQKN